MLAKASSQSISTSLTHRNREQAHSYRNGVSCATARRLDDEELPRFPRRAKPRQRQPPCRSNRRLRRSRRRQVCDVNGAGHTAIASKLTPTNSASASILKQPRAALLGRQPALFVHRQAHASTDHFQGAGSPNNRPCTPSIPISTITRCSPSVSTRSAINGRSILCAARWTASMNNRLWLSSSIARM